MIEEYSITGVGSRDAGAREDIFHPVAKEIRTARHHPRLRRQILQRDAALAGERIVAARDDDRPRAAQQDTVGERGLEIGRHRMKGAIDLPGLDALQGVAHLRLDDRDIDIREFRLKAREGGRQDREREHRSGADDDFAAPRRHQVVELALRAADLAHDDARAPLERPPECRRPHAMRRAIEDGAADRLLQQLHAARESRLAGVQPPRGIAQRAALNHREEIAQMT